MHDPTVSAIATLAVLLIGFLYNNSRLTDVRVSVKDSMDALRTVVEAKFGMVEAKFEMVEAKFQAVEANQRRGEDMLLGKFVELDDRLTRIENILKIR